MSKTNQYNSPTTASYGFTALPANQSLTPPSTSSPGAVNAEDIKIPDTEIARRALGYARKNLPDDTVKHSLRVFTYGVAVSLLHFLLLVSLSWEREGMSWGRTGLSAKGGRRGR
jgi:hypothetical protein